MNRCRFALPAALAAVAFSWGLALGAAPARAIALPPAPGAPAASFEVGTLHVDRYGAGADAVVLIPGLSCGPWEWFGTISHLAATRRVYVVTLPGFDGRVPQPTPAGQLFATTEKDLVALIAREGLKRPIVVGHSLGGTIAIGLAESYPAAARAVVSVDALPVSLGLAYQPPSEFAVQAASAAKNYAAMASPAERRAFVLQNIATLGAVDPAEMDAVLAKETTGLDRATEVANLRELLLTDLRPGLGKIVSPLLVVVPYYLPDNSTPPSVQPPIVFTKAQKVAGYRALLAGVRSLSLVAVEPARHFAMLDDPHDFEAALDAFLAANPF